MDHVFRSTRYVGDQPPAVLFGQALGVPVGICALPVMIAALVTMLQGGRPLPFLLVWFPVSLAVAWFWTASRLRTEVVELSLGSTLVSFRTRWEVATQRPSRPGSALLDVRKSGHDLLLTIGHETIALPRLRWTDLDRIEGLCRAARDRHLDRVRRNLEQPSRS